MLSRFCKFFFHDNHPGNCFRRMIEVFPCVDGLPDSVLAVFLFQWIRLCHIGIIIYKGLHLPFPVPGKSQYLASQFRRYTILRDNLLRFKPGSLCSSITHHRDVSQLQWQKFGPGRTEHTPGGKNDTNAFSPGFFQYIRRKRRNGHIIMKGCPIQIDSQHFYILSHQSHSFPSVIVIYFRKSFYRTFRSQCIKKDCEYLYIHNLFPLLLTRS